MLRWVFYLFAMHLAGDVPVIEARAEDVADGVANVVELDEPLFDGPFAEMRTGLLLLRIARHESAFDAKAKNAAGDCGVGQVASAMANMLGSSCGQMQESATEGFRVSLLVLHEAKHSCGSDLHRFLGAYASGKCGAAQHVVSEILGE
jgi:hypothetical protein